MAMKKNYLLKKIKNKKGFVILFAITLSSIVLAIALGVANIAFREIRFSTSTKDSNDAFFAADTGTEAVLFQDKDFTLCAPNPGQTKTCDYTIVNIGGSGSSCAKISITKDDTTSTTKTTIISKGYSVGDGACASSNQNRVEREIKTNY